MAGKSGAGFSTGRYFPVPGVPVGGDLTVTVRRETKADAGVALVNRITGAFQGGVFQLVVEDVNRRAAEAVAKGMYQQLQKEIQKTGRPQRKDLRLERSLLDDQNIFASVNGFSVGRTGWLDRSPARLYYRRIEEGKTTQRMYVRNLFSGGPGTPLAWPYNPNGVQGANGYHRGVPAGYLRGGNLKLIQRLGSGARLGFVGPFPAYRYSRGGTAAFGRFNYARKMTQDLKKAGIPMESFAL